MENLIEELKENIRRIKITISQNYWNKGYIENEKRDLISYENRLRDLQAQQGFELS